MDKEQTGRNLNMIRQARNMTVDELAKSMGIHTATVFNHMKQGINNIEQLLRYSEVLGCDPADLLKDSFDIAKYSLEKDITSFYPWNLAYTVMCGSVPTKGSVEKAHEFVYRVYVPALEEAIKELSEREQKVIELRFVHGLTYEQCGYRFNVTRERIRQIEQKALRKLRNPRYRKHYLLDTLDKVFKTDAERARLERENAQLIARLEAVGEKIEKRKDESRPRFKIDDMELSVRSYNCMKRAGFNYVDELEGKTSKDLKTVRNLSKKSMIEVIEKAKEFGVIIKWEE